MAEVALKLLAAFGRGICHNIATTDRIAPTRSPGKVGNLSAVCRRAPLRSPSKPDGPRTGGEFRGHKSAVSVRLCPTVCPAAQPEGALANSLWISGPYRSLGVCRRSRERNGPRFPLCGGGHSRQTGDQAGGFTVRRRRHGARGADLARRPRATTIRGIIGEPRGVLRRLSVPALRLPPPRGGFFNDAPQRHAPTGIVSGDSPGSPGDVGGGRRSGASRAVAKARL